MLLAVSKIAKVLSFVLPYLLSLTIGQVIGPLSLIAVVLIIAYKQSMPFSNIMSYLSLIVTALTKDISTITMSKPVSKGASVVRPVRQK